MLSRELSDEVEWLIRECSLRVMGTGNEQYSEGQKQRFERLPLEEVFQYTYEEIEDLIVYATMIHIRLRRLEKEVMSRIEHLRGLDCL